MKNLFVTFLFLLSATAYGQTLNVFTSGTTISSSQMNANFNYFDTKFWVLNSGNLVFMTGNVGIGTTSPTTEFEIHNDNDTGHAMFNQATFSSTASDTSIINLIRARGTSVSPVQLAIGDQLGQLRFSGETGTGFNAAATIEAYATGAYSNTSTPSTLIFKTTALGSAIPTERMRIIDTGFIGIGTSAPTSLLHVANDLTVDGTIYGTVVTPSDASLKKNIKLLTNPVEKIMALKGVTYDWKNTKKYGERHQIGVIAQDVKKVFPEAVTERKDGILTVSYDKLVAPLIEAVKNLHVRLLNLENKAYTSRLPASEEKLKKLEAENASMKAYLCQKDPAAPFCLSER